MNRILACGVLFAAMAAAPCAFAAADARGETLAPTARLDGAGFQLARAKAPEDTRRAGSDYAASEASQSRRDNAESQRERAAPPRDERRRRGLPRVPDSALMDSRGAL